MITFDIRGLDIVALLQFLLEKGPTIHKKIWRTESRITAVFLKEKFVKQPMFEQAFVVIVEYDVPSGKCRLEAIATDGIHATEGLELLLQKSIEELAHENGWQCELVPVEIVYKGTKCPSCGAIYEYPAEKIQDDGSVRCQNCNRTFVPGQE